MDLDERIKSRLVCETLEFKPYSLAETQGILKDRIKYAFVPTVWDDEALRILGEKTFEKKDVRTGIFLLRESGREAEDGSSKKITTDHVSKAITKLDAFHVKNADDLEDETKKILDVVKENSGGKIGDLYKKFQEAKGLGSYKSFQRRVEKLEKAGFVVVKKTNGGPEGNTSFVSMKEEKKITDY